MTARLIGLNDLAPEVGQCWVCSVPEGCIAGDSREEPQRSSLRLFENGREIGPAHSNHDEIRKFGGGRYSHWGRSSLSVGWGSGDAA